VELDEEVRLHCLLLMLLLLLLLLLLQVTSVTVYTFGISYLYEDDEVSVHCYVMLTCSLMHTMIVTILGLMLLLISLPLLGLLQSNCTIWHADKHTTEIVRLLSLCDLVSALQLGLGRAAMHHPEELDVPTTVAAAVPDDDTNMTDDNQENMPGAANRANGTVQPLGNG
jgi:hypothetical protein